MRSFYWLKQYFQYDWPNPSLNYCKAFHKASIMKKSIIKFYHFDIDESGLGNKTMGPFFVVK